MYTGILGTRCRTPTDLFDAGSATAQAVMSRTYHYARAPITSLRLAFANWWNESTDGMGGPGNGELASGTTLTVAASIEYPEGVFTQVTFSSGSSSLAISSGQTGWSDAISVTIPKNAKFFVRSFQQGTRFRVRCEHVSQGVVTYLDTANGDAVDTTGTNQTMSGTVTDDGSADWYGPAAIVGPTPYPSFGLLGHSRYHGFGDQAEANVGDIGEIARYLGPTHAYLSVAGGAMSAQVFVASHAQQLALLSYCSHLFIQLGGTDVLFGRTLSQIKADMAAIVDLFPRRPLYLTNHVPYSASTDGWITTVNQTPEADWAGFAALNEWLATCPLGAQRSYDFEAAVTPTPGSGIWSAPGGTNLTDDGLHMNVDGYQALQAAGVVAAHDFPIGWDAITRIQQGEDSDAGPVASLAVTLPSPVGIGRTLIARVAWTTFDGATASISGWAAGTVRAIESAVSQQSFLLHNAPGGATTVTVNFSGTGGNGAVLQVFEYQGLPSSGSIDGTPAYAGSADLGDEIASVQAGPVATTTMRALLLASLHKGTEDHVADWVPPFRRILRTSVGGINLDTAERIVEVKGSYSVSVSWADVELAHLELIAYKANPTLRKFLLH